jgi:hypothetical protein
VLIFICVTYFRVKTELKVIEHMSDPNSMSSDFLSNGPIKDILRPATLWPNLGPIHMSWTGRAYQFGSHCQVKSRLAPSLSPWVLIGYIQFIMRSVLNLKRRTRETCKTRHSLIFTEVKLSRHWSRHSSRHPSQHSHRHFSPD